MAKKTKATVESKLRALYDLQLIDSRIDEIVNLRGESVSYTHLTLPTILLV